jgi:cytochrome P450
MTKKITSIDLVGPEAIDDPHSYFGALRDESPVFWDERYRSWVITGYREVTTALRDPRFSSIRIAPFIRAKLSGPDTDPLMRQAFDVLAGWMVFQDAPDHMRLRNLVNRAFTARSVEVLRHHIEELADKLIDHVPAKGRFDLIEEVAAPLPSIIIAELLGVPVEDRPQFESWTRKVAPLVSGGLDDPTRYDGVAEGMDSLLNYFKKLVRHYEANPTDNLITQLIRARDEGDRLNEAEVLATCTLILFGGHETTANFIATAIRQLLLHPDQFAALRDRKVDDNTAIEECLRFDGPAKALTRVLSESFEFEGQQMQAGQRVFLILAGANRDPAAFDDPNTFKLDRDLAQRHIAFGFGPHFCMGAMLARLEGSILIPKIVRRMPDIRLADKQADWMPVLLTRGMKTLFLERGA